MREERKGNEEAEPSTIDEVEKEEKEKDTLEKEKEEEEGGQWVCIPDIPPLYKPLWKGGAMKCSVVLELGGFGVS